MTAARITSLPNGLRIVTDPVSSVETATIGLWVGAGSRNEDAANHGVSHFLEHMAFKGTTTRSAQKIAEEIEDVGGYLNAYTSREATAYLARVMATDVPLAMDLVADIVMNSIFDPEEFERERGVILQEIAEAEDTPEDVAFDMFQAAAFPDQPLGRPILGTPASLRSFTTTSLKSYMQAHYQPSAMVVVASGRIDPDSFLRQVESLMGGLATTTAAPKPAVASYQGLQIAERRAVEQAHWILGYQGVSALDGDHYAFVVLATLLGGGMSSRLFQEVREKQGLAYSVEAFHTAYADAGVFGIHAGTDPQDLERLQTTVHQVIDACHTDFCTAHTPDLTRELARAKAQLKSGTLMGLEGLSARAERFAQHVLRWNRLLPTSETLQRLDDVTATDLVRCIDSMRSRPETLAIVGPRAMDLSKTGLSLQI